MEDENELADSETGEDLELGEEETGIKEQRDRLVEQNRKLFARAKKAEGFTLDEEGKWIKAEKKVVAEEKSQAKSGELDYGQLSYLLAKGIESDEEVSLVQKVMQETGKPLKEVLAAKYFQAELKEVREARQTAEVVSAVSRAGKRSGQTATSDAEYWLAKVSSGTPFAEVPRDLQREVLNTRIQREKDHNKFSPNPVIVG